MAAPPPAQPLRFDRLSLLFRLLQRAGAANSAAADLPRQVDQLLKDEDVHECLTKLWPALGDQAKIPHGALKETMAERMAAQSLSKAIDVHEDAALELLRSSAAATFAQEAVAASRKPQPTMEVPGQPASKRKPREFSEQDKFNVIDFYFEQRVLLMRSLCQMVRITLSPDNILQDVCREFVEQQLIAKTPTLLARLLELYSATAKAKVSAYFVDHERLTPMWIRQNLREQAVLLELLFILLYDQLPCPWDSLVGILTTFKEHQFGQHTHAALRAADTESQHLVRVNVVMSVFVIINAMRLETFLAPAFDDIVSPAAVFSADTFRTVNDIVDQLTNHELLATPTTPIQVAWACILIRLTDLLRLPGAIQEFFGAKTGADITTVVERANALMSTAFNRHIFSTLVTMISESSLQSESSVFKSVSKGLLMLVMTAYPLQALPVEFQMQMSQLFSAIFTEYESLCLQFWLVDYAFPERRSLLDLAQNEFPENPGLITLLASLSGETAKATPLTAKTRSAIHYVTQYCKEIQSFTHWTSKVDISSHTFLNASDAPLTPYHGSGSQNIYLTVSSQNGLRTAHKALPGQSFTIPLGFRGLLLRSTATNDLVKWEAPFPMLVFVRRLLDAQLLTPEAFDPHWLCPALDLFTNLLTAHRVGALPDLFDLLASDSNCDATSAKSSLLLTIFHLIKVTGDRLAIVGSEGSARAVLLSAFRCATELVVLTPPGQASELVNKAHLVGTAAANTTALMGDISSSGLLPYILERIEQPSSNYAMTKAAVTLLCTIMRHDVIANAARLAVGSAAPETLTIGNWSSADHTPSLDRSRRNAGTEAPQATVIATTRSILLYLYHWVLSGSDSRRYQRIADRFQLGLEILRLSDDLLSHMSTSADPSSPGVLAWHLLMSPTVLEAILGTICLGSEYLANLLRRGYLDAAHTAEELIQAALSLLIKFLLAPEQIRSKSLLPTLLEERAGVLASIASYPHYLFHVGVAASSFKAMAAMSHTMTRQDHPLSLIAHIGPSNTSQLSDLIVHVLQKSTAQESQPLPDDTHDLLLSVLDFLATLLPHNSGLVMRLLDVPGNAPSETATAATKPSDKKPFVSALIDIVNNQDTPFDVLEAALRTLGHLWTSSGEHPQLLQSFRSSTLWTGLLRLIQDIVDQGDHTISSEPVIILPLEAVALAQRLILGTRVLDILVAECAMSFSSKETANAFVEIIRRIKIQELFAILAQINERLCVFMRSLRAPADTTSAWIQMFPERVLVHPPRLPSTTNYSWCTDLMPAGVDYAETALPVQQWNAAFSLADALTIFLDSWVSFVQAVRILIKAPLWLSTKPPAPSSSTATTVPQALLRIFDSIKCLLETEAAVSPQNHILHLMHAHSRMLCCMIAQLRLHEAGMQDQMRSSPWALTTAVELVNILVMAKSSASATTHVVWNSDIASPVCSPSMTLWLQSLMILTVRRPTNMTGTEAPPAILGSPDVFDMVDMTVLLQVLSSILVSHLVQIRANLSDPTAPTRLDTGKIPIQPSFSLSIMDLLVRLLRMRQSDTFLASMSSGTGQALELLRELLGTLQLFLQGLQPTEMGRDYIIYGLRIVTVILQTASGKEFARPLVLNLAALDLGSLLCFNNYTTALRLPPPDTNSMPTQGAPHPNVVRVVLAAMEVFVHMLMCLRQSTPPPALIHQVIAFASLVQGGCALSPLIAETVAPLGPLMVDDKPNMAIRPQLYHAEVVMGFYRELAHYWSSFARVSGNFVPGSMERTLAILLTSFIHQVPTVLAEWLRSLQLIVRATRSMPSAGIGASTLVPKPSTIQLPRQPLAHSVILALTQLLDALRMILPPLGQLLSGGASWYLMPPSMRLITSDYVMRQRLLSFLNDAHAVVLNLMDNKHIDVSVAALQSILTLWVSLVHIVARHEYKSDAERLQVRELVQQSLNDLSHSARQLIEKRDIESRDETLVRGLSLCLDVHSLLIATLHTRDAVTAA